MSELLKSRISVALQILAAGLLSIIALLTTCRAGDDPWPEIQKSVFQGRAISDGDSKVQIFAPNQADDAAVVPVSVRIDPSVVSALKFLTLVIDRNPMPVAATFAFGDGFRSRPEVGDRTLATRIRVDAFSRVRAIIETTSGELYMASKFVIGAGGCSAPSSKDLDQALAQIGRTQIKVSKDDARGPTWREAQIMIKHPNFTGMQINAANGQFAPARYVTRIEVRLAGAVLFSMDGGISISEDPNIRFTYGTGSASEIEFDAIDSDGAKFTGKLSADPS